jgi:ABC-type sugar transport system ATPase subunit
MNAGLAYIPEDRKIQGLALELSCRKNFSLTIPEKIRRWLFLDHRKETALVQSFFRLLGIKTSSPETPVSSLSGGNQQKVVLAKWLARDAKVYILDEPTRGIDIGAKTSIHGIIREMAGKGAAILLISSELPEILSLSHRIIVLREGTCVGEIDGSTATQESLLRMMSGL